MRPAFFDFSKLDLPAKNGAELGFLPGDVPARPQPMSAERSPSMCWSQGRLMSVERCPACGSGDREGSRLEARDAFNPASSDIWQVWSCKACRSLYLDPRPDAISLPEAYKTYYTHSRVDRASGRGQSRWILPFVNGYLNQVFGFSRHPANPLGHLLFKALPPLSLKLDYYGAHLFHSEFPARGTLLDVGCGNGEFLSRAREMGWVVTGVDPDPVAVAACRQQGLETYEGTADTVLESLEGHFDVLISSHSLEHCESPMPQLNAFGRLLRPGGRLWLALPNPRSMGARFFGSAWRGLEPPRHLCIPSQRRLIELLESAGFEQVNLVRRGIHSASMCGESASMAVRLGSLGMRWRALAAPLLRLLADAAATLSGRWGEETVLVATRRQKV